MSDPDQLQVREIGFGHEAEPFIDVLYETSSAVGTVGWSTGITPDLSTAATVVVMVTILVGRFLPLLLVLQIARSRKAPVGAQLVDNVRLG